MNLEHSRRLVTTSMAGQVLAVGDAGRVHGCFTPEAARSAASAIRAVLVAWPITGVEQQQLGGPITRRSQVQFLPPEVTSFQPLHRRGGRTMDRQGPAVCMDAGDEANGMAGAGRDTDGNSIDTDGLGLLRRGSFWGRRIGREPPPPGFRLAVGSKPDAALAGRR